MKMLPRFLIHLLFGFRAYGEAVLTTVGAGVAAAESPLATRLALPARLHGRGLEGRGVRARGQNSRARRSIIILSAIFGSMLHLAGAVPILEWDPNDDPEVAGYIFYSGEKSGVYDRVIDVGGQTSIALTNLDPGITYYFALTAYTIDLLESPFSEEVSYTARIDGVTAFIQSCAVSLADGTATVSFYGKSGRMCWVEASSDFETWERIDSGLIVDDGIIEVLDPDALNQPLRIYRVVASPP